MMHLSRFLLWRSIDPHRKALETKEPMTPSGDMGL